MPCICTGWKIVVMSELWLLHGTTIGLYFIQIVVTHCNNCRLCKYNIIWKHREQVGGRAMLLWVNQHYGGQLSVKIYRHGDLAFFSYNWWPLLGYRDLATAKGRPLRFVGPEGARGSKLTMGRWPICLPQPPLATQQSYSGPLKGPLWASEGANVSHCEPHEAIVNHCAVLQ